jgi:hypothetical protein
MDAILQNLNSSLHNDASPITKDILSLSSPSEGTQELALRNIINFCLEGSAHSHPPTHFYATPWLVARLVN